MTGSIRSDANTLVASFAGTDEYTMRAGGGLPSNPKDIVTFGVSKIAYGVAQAMNGLPLKDWTIPPWARRVTIGFADLSTNGAGTIAVRLGTGGVIKFTGYASSYNTSVTTSINTINTNDGFDFAGSAANIVQGFITLINLTGNTWLAGGSVGFTNAQAAGVVAGMVTLSGPLDTIRLTTSNGTDLYDQGTANVMWE